MQASLQCSLDDHGIATLVLDRPRSLNAIDAGLRDELRDAVERLATDASVGSVIITGAGGNFCAGGDVKTMGGISTVQEGRERILALQPLVRGLLEFPKPVIAAVEGVAYGAGFGLALAADLVIAGEGARFCCSFGRVGLVPDFALAYTLPRLVGMQKARQLVFSARELSAGQALQEGVVAEVCPGGRALARARQLARHLEDYSPTAFGLTKQMLAASLQSDLATMLRMEADAQAVAFASAEHVKAARRFAARKPPRFSWPETPVV